MSCMSYDDFRNLKQAYDLIRQVRMRNKDKPLDESLKSVQEDLIDSVDADIIAWFTEDLNQYDKNGNIVFCKASLTEPLNNPLQKVTYSG